MYFKTEYKLNRLNNCDIAFSKDGIYGILDNDGNIKVPRQFGIIYAPLCSDNMIYTFKLPEQHKWGLIDNAGNIKLPANYDGELEFLGGIYYNAVLGDYDGVVSLNGDVILPFEYDDSSINFIEYNENFIVGKNGKYGVVNPKNETVIPFEYDYICQTFAKGKYENCLFARLNGREGIITLNNEIVVPLKYESIRILSDETLLISDNDGDLEYITDYDFNKIRDTEFSDIGIYGDLANGYANISYSIGGFDGIMDKYGNIKIECK